jgi:hypothetical protein
VLPQARHVAEQEQLNNNDNARRPAGPPTGRQAAATTAKKPFSPAASDVTVVLEAGVECSNVRRSFLDLAEGVLSIKRNRHRVNVASAILKFTVAVTAAALMLADVSAQSSGQSTPPAPTQSAVQAPVQQSSGAQTPEQPPQVVKRNVTVTFDYDFSKFPPCSAKVTKKCIQQFDVWEVSDPAKQVFLFTVPVPPGAKGLVKGITGTSPNKQAYFTGPHRFGVSAKTPAPGGESNPRLCMTFAQVLPDKPASPASDSSSPQK